MKDILETANPGDLEPEATEAAPPPAPARREGFRLRRLEIKNFGGYHGPAQVFDFDLEGAVFSGANGAGKSTAIDAYRMLFRPAPSFNSATDGKKDRSVESYYLGQHGKKDGPAGRKPVCLRQHGVPEGVMAICGVFETDAGEVLSILRMGYARSPDSGIDWNLITGPVDLSIERDFPAWLPKGACARAADALGATRHATYDDYFAAIGAALGIENLADSKEAFRFLDQAIGMKRLDSVILFGRANVFPQTTLAKSADGAIAIFEEVQAASRQIERTETEIKSLAVVMKRFDSYERALGAHAEAVGRKARVDQFSAWLREKAAHRLGRRTARRIAGLEQDRAAAEEAIAAAEHQVEAIATAIRENGFDQLDTLKDDLHGLLNRLHGVEEQQKSIAARFSGAGMTVSFDSESAYAASFEKVISRISELEAQIDENEEGLVQARQEARVAREGRTAAASALETLLRNRTSVEGPLLRMRAALAEHLRLRHDEIPFLAELVQVHPDQTAWEGAANRVLGALGCEVLVEAGHVAAARRFVNSRHWGARVVLREVHDLAPRRGKDLHPEALARKIEVKHDSRFADIARDLVDRHAGHVCLSGDEFARTGQDYAVTVEGTVKARGRIVKDDRSRIDDRGSYVLGWNVEDRIALAKERLDEADAALAAADRTVAEFSEGLAALRKRRDGLVEISGAQAPFTQVDTAPLKKTEAEIRARISALDSKKAEDLRTAREEALARKKAAEDRRATLDGQLGSARHTQASARAEIDRQACRLSESVAANGPMTRADRAEYVEALRAEAGVAAGRPVLVDVLATREADLPDLLLRVSRTIDANNNSEANISKRASEVTSAALGFLKEFPESDLEAGVTGRLKDNADMRRAELVRGEWRSRHARLVADDLPRHREAFESRRGHSAVDAVRQIRTEANAYAQRIRAIEKGFNRILADQVFNPSSGTRARMRIRPATDHAAIVRFRSKLERAEGVLFSDDPSVVEKVVEDLIDDIRVEGDSKRAIERRAAILDLRNWYEMDVEEYSVDETGAYAEQVRVYSGSDGMSGGEGERLAMLLVGAAMLYTFGACDETRPGVGLQVVMLDEAFMHGSEETAEAATDVLAAMGLQVIAATPVQKLQAFAGKTERVFGIYKRDEQIFHTTSTYAELVEEGARLAAA